MNSQLSSIGSVGSYPTIEDLPLQPSSVSTQKGRATNGGDFDDDEEKRSKTSERVRQAGRGSITRISLFGLRSKSHDGVERDLESGEGAVAAKPCTKKHHCERSLDEMKVEDLYEGEHLPPVSLRDFENYLSFKVRAPENLYFDIWLRYYTTLWSSSPPELRSPSQHMALNSAHSLLLTTFLNPSSSLELNLSNSQRLLLGTYLSTSSAADPFIPPSTFNEIAIEVRHNLQSAFRDFIALQSKNADHKRSYFSAATGLLGFVGSWIPVITSVCLGLPKGYRVIGAPIMFIGLVGIICGLQKMCMVLYFSRNLRQLYPWEQVQSSSPSSQHITSPLLPSPTTASPHLPTLAFFPPRPDDPDGPPAAPIDESAPMLAWGVPVRNHAVQRRQRLLVLKASVWAFFGTGIAVGVWWALPNAR